MGGLGNAAELSEVAAARVLDAYSAYRRAFAEITLRAKQRFERRDWHAVQDDARERLSLYSRSIAAVALAIRALLDAQVEDTENWQSMRNAFAARIAGRGDAEIARTYFNSLTRKIFATVGVDPRIEFLLEEHTPPTASAVVRYDASAGLAECIERLIADCGFEARFADLPRDAARAADALASDWRLGLAERAESIDLLPRVFYRNKGAYLIGRVWCAGQAIPLALALRHPAEGIVIDAVLHSADELSIIFSFTHWYFHVDAPEPRGVVEFLKSIMPRKPTAELYIAIGHTKHGKSELFRDLLDHFGRSREPFETAHGDRGMVMIVFTLPSYDVVFKVIRDRFDFPKNSSRSQVMEKYRLVMQHDRAGRLADVQEFEHLAFPRDRFAPPLLDELLQSAAETVHSRGEVITLRHVYTQRRMIPLNLYLQRATPDAAREAILDYGQAVKDLALTNIFPGDMLLKNFGVTRHGRVIFYDYDEICPLAECQFRDLPTPRDYDEEVGGEPWFFVDPRDVFPEEFLKFLGLQGAAREAFLEAHGDLLTPRYWRELQARHRAGEIMDIIPYRAHRRLRRV